MIIVSIDVPMLGERYDFQIDEDAVLQRVLDEVTDLICRKNLFMISGDAKQIGLWDAGRKIRLDSAKTAYENGLITGSELLLA